MKRCLFIFSILGIFVSTTLADGKDSSQVSSLFLQTHPGARETALGGDQVAIKGRVSSLFSNPANLTTIPVPELWFTHHQSFIDTNEQVLSFGMPTPRAAFGFSARYLNFGKFNRTGVDSDNLPISDLGEIRPYIGLVQGTGAWRLSPRVSLGGSLKAWRESLDQTDQNGWAGDLGILAQSVIPSLDLGLAVRNLGPKLDGYDLPRSFVAGGAYHLSPRWLKSASVFTEYEHLQQVSDFVRSGIEVEKSNVFGRVGYQHMVKEGLDDINPFSLGLGFRFKGMQLDYAWKDGGPLGQEHRVSFGLGFGLTPEERSEAKQSLDLAIRNRLRSKADLLMVQGREYMDQIDWKNAVNKFSEALIWDPNNAEAVALFETAETNLRKQRSAQLLSQSQTYLEQERWMDAALSLNEILNENPNHKEAKKLLAHAMKKSEEDKKKNPTNGELQRAYQRGVDHYINGEFDSALKAWQTVVKKNPAWPGIHEYMAKAQSKIWEMEATRKHSEATPEKMVETLSFQAYSFYAVGNTKQAIATWKKILALDPRNSDAAWALNEAEKKLDLSGGVSGESFAKPVEELNNAALRAYAAGKINQAASIWRIALKMDPQNPDVRNNLSRVEKELLNKGESR